MASAVRLPGGSPHAYQLYQDWQREAWRFYDITGELRFAANYIANVLSRATLLAGKRTRTGTTSDPNVTSAKAQVAMADLFGGPEGQASMLSAMGLHMTVAGEGYLVGQQAAVGQDVWQVIGTQEMRNRGSNWYIDYGITGMKQVQLADTDIVIRIWRPHPRRRIEADCPVRALLPILTELEYLTRHIFAQVTSRLAGAGIIFLPQSMKFPAPPADQPNLTELDAFMAMLGEAMMAPIKDPGNAASLVPVAITIPDELVGHAAELMHFWSDLDQHAVDLRTEAIRRFAAGMDLPAEILLGLARAGAAANHWTAWQIEEASIKVHIEPLLQLICDALTESYLIPATGDPTDAVLYDTSDIRLRPDRSKEALELYDRGQLDGASLRRENGFDESDAMDPEQLKQFLLRKVASGSTTPDQVAAALRALGVGLDGGGAGATQERPTPSLDGHPGRTLPEPPVRNGPAPGKAATPRERRPVGRPSTRPETVAASEALVFRALERAGNRIRSKAGVRVPNCSANETYLYVRAQPDQLTHLLEDAWSCAPRVFDGITDNVPAVVSCLDNYCRALLVGQTPHTRDAMCAWLEKIEAQELMVSP
jgi:hypothetical protein